MQDLAENGIEVELMHLGSSFNVSLFYQVRSLLRQHIQFMYESALTVYTRCPIFIDVFNEYLISFISNEINLKHEFSFISSKNHNI